MTKLIQLSLNGLQVLGKAESSTTLLEFIRNEAQLTGTKRGCDTGECGCCSVLIDGQSTLSCLMLAEDAVGRNIQTIEGISAGTEPHPVQVAMVEEGAIQCGFCTPAMVVNAVALLTENPKPTRDEIKECVSGTVCRCTGYTKIEKAISRAAQL